MSDSDVTAAEKSLLGAEDLPKVPFVMNGLSSRFIRENLVVPLELKQNRLRVAMADPSDGETIDALRVATSSEVSVVKVDPLALNEYISRFYGQEPQNINKIVE